MVRSNTHSRCHMPRYQGHSGGNKEHQPHGVTRDDTRIGDTARGLCHVSPCHKSRLACKVHFYVKDHMTADLSVPNEQVSSSYLLYMKVGSFLQATLTLLSSFSIASLQKLVPVMRSISNASSVLCGSLTPYLWVTFQYFFCNFCIICHRCHRTLGIHQLKAGSVSIC